MYKRQQVKKIEDSQKLRDDLGLKYLEYLKRESVYLRVRGGLLAADYEAPRREHTELDQKISYLRLQLAKKGDDIGATQLVHLEEEGRSISLRRDTAGRELGRIEGELSAEERIQKVVEEAVPGAQVREFAHRVEEELEASLSLEEGEIKSRMAALLNIAKDFLRRITRVEVLREGRSKEELQARKAELEEMLKQLMDDEAKVLREVATLRHSIDSEKDASREAERELFAAMARRSELESKLHSLRAKSELIERESEIFKGEVGEAAALVGRMVQDYEATTIFNQQGGLCSDADMADEARSFQEDRRKKIERLKIRLEEAGLGNTTEILREHQETIERDAFLARELLDLETSTQSLHQLIAELTKTLGVRFAGGIEKINTEFNTFFTLMFGGGSAALTFVEASAPRKSRASSEEDSFDEEPEPDGDRRGAERDHQRGVEPPDRAAPAGGAAADAGRAAARARVARGRRADRAPVGDRRARAHGSPRAQGARRRSAAAREHVERGGDQPRRRGAAALARHGR